MDRRGTIKGARGSRNKTYTRWSRSIPCYDTAWSLPVTCVCIVLACIHQSCQCMAWQLFAGELHVDSAVFIACALEPVVSKHLWALNTAGQVWWRPWEWPDCHRSGQVLSLVWSTVIPAPFLIMMAIPSLNTPTRPAGLGTRTAMIADKINNFYFCIR
jgi:hypothetical protein